MPAKSLPLAAAHAAVEACRALRQGELTVRSLQEWFGTATKAGV